MGRWVLLLAGVLLLSGCGFMQRFAENFAYGGPANADRMRHQRAVQAELAKPGPTLVHSTLPSSEQPKQFQIDNGACTQAAYSAVPLQSAGGTSTSAVLKDIHGNTIAKSEEYSTPSTSYDAVAARKGQLDIHLGCMIERGWVVTE